MIVVVLNEVIFGVRILGIRFFDRVCLQDESRDFIRVVRFSGGSDE